MDIREYLERIWGDSMMLFSTFLAWVILKNYDYFNFESWFGDDIAFLLYLIGFYIVFLVIGYIPQLFVTKNNIKILQTDVPDKDYVDDSHLEKGNNYFGFLEIEIPSDWIASDCYITLERVVPIYFSDKKIIEDGIEKLNLKKYNPEYKLLRWRSPLSDDSNRKINIGENSNREAFSVGKIVTILVKKSAFAQTSIKTFDFDSPKIKKGTIDYKDFGLYEFSIIFHWHKNGKKMRPKKSDCYIYIESEGIKDKIFVGVGDYKNDSRIPKPLLNNGD